MTVLIDQDQIDFFEKNGYILLRNVLDELTVETLRDRGDRLVQSDDAFFRIRDEEFENFRNLLFLDQAFLKLVDLEVVLVPVLQLIGFNIHLSSVHLSYIYSHNKCRPWRGDWHTDIYGFEDDLQDSRVRVGVKCAFALTSHEKSDSGTTILIPGTHKEPVRQDLDRQDPAPFGAIQLAMNAGDCLIFENRLYHSRGHNLSHQTRKCVLVGYTYKWLIPLDSLQGFDLLPEDSLSPITQDLWPRPYGVSGNGALAALCDRYALPLRPTRLRKNSA